MIIYLDQNKWIDLAKAILNPTDNPNYVEVSNLVLEKIENGEWIFPLSTLHVWETGSRAEEESRKKLVSVMAKISNGYSIKSFLDVQKDELINIFIEICAPEKIKKIEAIIKNPLVAIGAEDFLIKLKTDILPTNVKQELIDIIDSYVRKNIENKDIANIILDNYDEEFVNGLREDDKILTRQFEKDRINLLKLPKQDRYNIFLIQRFWAMIKLLNINIHKLCEKNTILKSLSDDKNKCINFLEGAPSINISTKLTYELLKDRERHIHEHDNRDINFLSTAIPYCDIVITEKTWKHLVKINKLDDKYSTIIENDLNYLLRLNEQVNKAYQ